jgi:hypothetical protein
MNSYKGSLFDVINKTVIEKNLKHLNFYCIKRNHINLEKYLK